MTYDPHPLYDETPRERKLASHLKELLIKEFDRIGNERVAVLLKLHPFGVERVRGQNWNMTTAMRIALALEVPIKVG